MSNEMIRRNIETALDLTNLGDLMKATADNPMLLIDCSGSMLTTMRNGKTRIDGLREIVRDLQAQGNVPMIAFGGPYDAQVRFVDGVPDPDGGTPLHLAIPFAKEYGATRLVVISDGAPDLRDQSMMEATAFGGRIDAVFVGDPGDFGEAFLQALAAATGGTSSTGSLTEVKALGAKIMGLLEGEVKAPIQGEGFTTVDDVLDAEEDDDDDEDDDDEDEDDDDEEDDEDA